MYMDQRGHCGISVVGLLGLPHCPLNQLVGTLMYVCQSVANPTLKGGATTSYTCTRLLPCHMTISRDITFQEFQCTSSRC